MYRRLLRAGAGLGVVTLFLGVTAVSRSAPRDTGFEIIDVLAVYTATAESKAGGAGAISSAIDSQVIMANEVLANSGITAQLRLTGTQKLTGYRGPDDVNGAAKAVSADQTVATAREDAGADLVAAFVGGAGSGGNYGVGLTPNETPADATSSSADAFTALRLDIAPPHALAHEIGHNLGAGHDHLTGGSDAYPGFPQNHGWGSPYKDRVTVMSYQGICEGCQLAVPYYSSPDLLWNGEPSGVSRDADPCDPDITKRPADNASVVAANAPGVARYRKALAANETRSQVLIAKGSPIEGGRAVPATPGPYAKEAQVEVTAEARDGYTFTGWEVDGKPGASEPTLTVDMTGEREVVAKFERNEATELTVEIKPEAAAGALVSYARTLTDVVEYPKGATAERLRPMAAPGWRLDEWQIDGQPVPRPGVNLPMTEPHTVTVIFDKAIEEPPTGPVVQMAKPGAGTRPVLSGIATPDSTVTITDAEGAELGTTTVVGDGTWQFRPRWDFPSGATDLRLTATKNEVTSDPVPATVRVSGMPVSASEHEIAISAEEFSAAPGETTTTDVVLATCATYAPNGLQQAFQAPSGFVFEQGATAKYGSGAAQEVESQLYNNDTVLVITTDPKLNTGRDTQGPLVYTVTLRASGDAAAGTSSDGFAQFGGWKRVKLTGTVTARA